MARTALPYSAATPNGSITTPAGTNVDQANGMTIANAEPEKTLLRVTNTNGSARNLIIRAGVMPPALASGQGDLTVSVPATTGDVIVGPFESGRFLQKDGSMSVDFGASFAGAITAIKVPRNT